MKVTLKFVILACFFLAVTGNAATFPAFNKVEVASGLDFPWSLAFLPDGRLLVTERSGSLRIINNGQVSEPIAGLPEVYAHSQGGLMDVVLHPNYQQNGWLYISFAHGDENANATRLIRAKLNGTQLQELEVLFTVDPSKDTPAHYGGRLTFLPDNTLLLTTGDGFDYREEAQKLDSLLGKIVRLHDDGRIPQDNPFIGKVEVRSEIWSYGHRNPQGILYDLKRQMVISHEHGPKGGDEINYIEAGKNYGWPVITYGRDYFGSTISPYQEYPGMEPPILDWTPSIAPSGMAVYYGELFPSIQGDLLITALASQELRWVKLQDTKVVEQQSLLSDMNTRFRDVRVGPEGAIYLLTDSPQGKIIKLIPTGS